MPLVSYFSVAGCCLVELMLLSDAVLPQPTRGLISSNFQGLAAPHAKPRLDHDWTPAPAPDMSSPAVLAAEPPRPEPETIQQAAAEPSAQAVTPVPKKRRQVARRQPWRDDYAQADGWSWSSSWNSGPSAWNSQYNRFR